METAFHEQREHFPPSFHILPFSTEAWLLQQLCLHQQRQKVRLFWEIGATIRPRGWRVWAAGDCASSVFGFNLFLLLQKVEHSLKNKPKRGRACALKVLKPLSQVGYFFPLGCSVRMSVGPLSLQKQS